MKRVIFILTILVTILTSCDKKPSMTFEHADKEQVIQCDPELDALLNEALYVFEESITDSYDPESKATNKAYARFIYVGFAGTAEYDRIASKKALEIRDALVSEGILQQGGVKSNLNYSHPTVKCIVSKIEDTDLKSTIGALIETNTMDPKLLNTRMRSFGTKASKNRYESFYVALDSYYQNLVGVELALEETTTNE